MIGKGILRRRDMILYKLTNQDNTTYGGMKWGVGVKHTTKFDKRYSLCSEDLIHAYRDPLLAVFYNPIHGDYPNPKLWECETHCKKVIDNGLKLGVKSLTTIKEIELPVITTEQLVEIAIRISLKVYHEESYINWAQRWIDGTDRAWAAARAAEEIDILAIIKEVTRR